jgi:hypothetical protein
MQGATAGALANAEIKRLSRAKIYQYLVITIMTRHIVIGSPFKEQLTCSSVLYLSGMKLYFLENVFCKRWFEGTLLPLSE